MSIVSRLIGCIFKLPPAQTYDVVVEKDLTVTMRDGVVLLADHYAPRGSEGKLPTVLIRGPYGRRGGSLFGRAIAERGYQVLLQSVRGTDGSGGMFDPFCQEREDGLDTLEWIERQPWYSGSLVTFGASYLGFVQWAIATEAGSRLKAMAVQIAFSNLRDAVYPGGAFALQTFLGWMSMMSNPSLLSTLLRFISGDRKFKQALIQLPLGDIDKIVTGHEVSYYQQWLQHDVLGDPYWTPTSFSNKVGEVSAPVHLLGGWYDFFLPSTVRDYTALQKAGKKPYLTIGPWAHSDFAHNGVAIDEALAFFNAYVKGEKGRLRDQPVRIWVNGAEEWRHYPDFPPPGTQYQRWYLQDRGGLAPMPPDDSAPDIYRYDPSDPTPAFGGPLGPGLNVKAGSVDNRVLERRSDVLTYTSLPLKCDMEVIGPVSTELYVRSSLKHTDFFVSLCDVEPSGKSLNVCDGLQRLFPDRPPPEQDSCLKIVFDLWPTAHRFCRRHYIRLQVSSGAFPRWARNLGTGEPLATGTRLQVAEQNVYHNPTHPSAVILPCQGS